MFYTAKAVIWRIAYLHNYCDSLVHNNMLSAKMHRGKTTHNRYPFQQRVLTWSTTMRVEHRYSDTSNKSLCCLHQFLKLILFVWTIT